LGNDFRFCKNKIKGSFGTEIISTMLSAFKYDVIPFGYEYTVSALQNKLQDKDWWKRGKGTNAEKIVRCMPDYIVVDEKNREVFLLEVKFAKSSRFKNGCLDGGAIKDIKGYVHHWGESYIVFVTSYEDCFYIEKIKDLKKIDR
jgi:hypothetical protein